MKRHELTQADRARGGRNVAARTPPDECPRCGRPMAGRTWHQWLGHKGLHGLADAYFGGDLRACHERLRRNGLARQDPNPFNGATPDYKPVKETNE